MSKTAPTFRPITTPLDVDDAALDKLNDRLGVPTMVPARAQPIAEAKGSPEEEPKVNGSGTPSPSRTNERGVKKTTAAAMPPRGPVEKLTIELPGYLTDALKHDALKRRTTARHVVMLGLQALGFQIKPEDLVPDARRTRKPARP